MIIIDSIKGCYWYYKSKYEYLENNNIRKAKEYLKKSADLNYREAQFTLGMFYENGIVDKKDLTKAMYWYLKASENNHRIAQFNLGSLALEQEDNEKAIYSFMQSANQNYAPAQHQLAVFYLNKFTVKDNEIALYWLNEAMKQDFKPAIELFEFLIDTINEKMEKEKKEKLENG